MLSWTLVQHQEAHLATPTYIPINYGIGNHSGPLGTQKVGAYRTVELEVLYPKRPIRIVTIPPREFYYDDDGTMVYKVQCTVCDHYQRREAFSPDPRKKNGLQSACKSCDAARKRESRRIA